MAVARSLCRFKDKAPDVFVTFGIEQQFRFISHPGVMAISKLLEMKQITRMRAHFTQDNVDKMKEFDPELSRKAQIALDNDLPVNFQQLELIDDILPRLMEEKKQLEVARTTVLKLPAGTYDFPKALDVSACAPAPNAKGIEGTAAELIKVKYPDNWKVQDVPKIE
eukprot:gnl/TRDRNA2_/TRDRNA2_132646_c0_seq4.p2 gnl/TRDRNA2_/TRDRNA2_132646_c0~~gnl/TRDRNA2_/TRDRNA2_132646_c0_seq4.p2  ORF type:complete len:166 (+),score=50.57 gnl/TRDRNA2_/TRDRNA2_132646_c0_seq4:92-589(+)